VFTFLRRLLDPRGPVGEIVSPTIAFKSRQGMPVSSPHTQRVDAFTVRPEEIAHACAPVRYVAVGNETPPAGRVRLASRYVEERWSPVYAKTDSEVISEIVAAGQTLVGWKIVQSPRAPYCDCTSATFTKEGDEFIHLTCGRGRRHLSDQEYIEQVQSLQIQVSDEWANGFYETIPGDDFVMTSAGPAKGGTRITGGRAEYRRKTKGFIHWDKGFLQQRAKAQDAEQSKWKKGVRPLVEKLAAQILPHRGEL